MGAADEQHASRLGLPIPTRREVSRIYSVGYDRRGGPRGQGPQPLAVGLGHYQVHGESGTPFTLHPLDQTSLMEEIAREQARLEPLRLESQELRLDAVMGA